MSDNAILPKDCTCGLFASPMDIAALGHMTGCPIRVQQDLTKTADVVLSLSQTQPRPKLYVSSKLKHRDLWLSLNETIVSTWIHGEELPPEECSDMWDRYREEISQATHFVLHFEYEDQLKGCMAELGMAFHAGIKIVIVSDLDKEVVVRKLGTLVYHNSVTYLRGGFDCIREYFQTPKMEIKYVKQRVPMQTVTIDKFGRFLREAD